MRLPFFIKRVITALIPLALVTLLACVASPLPPGSTFPSASSPALTTSSASTPAVVPVAVTPSPSAGTQPINPGWVPPQINSGTALQPDFPPVVSRVTLAVVSIDVRVTSFNIFNQPITQQGAGSGWIIDAGGLIVTNNHVVEGAQEVGVTLADGRSFPAKQVVADSVSDLAVVKIDATGLPVLTIGDANNLKVGMMVMAIGNALGEGISMTGGWVSRKGASVTISSINETLYDLIETDAAINPGNSGGPLINTAGEVVGITNAKLVATGVELIGYAISINTAMPIVEQLIKNGYVLRPWFGVTLQTVTPAIATIYGLSVDKGALITAIAANSPASNAGLKQGDVIVSINGKDVATASDAAQAIRSTQIGQKVKVTYWRGKDQLSTDVIPTQNPNL